MKPSLPQLRHRQTTGLLNARVRTSACPRMRARLGRTPGYVADHLFPNDGGTWADRSWRNVVLICLFRVFCQADGARLRLRGEGERRRPCLAPFCTDRRAGPCKWQPEPEDVCWLLRGLLQPAGEVSVAPYGAGKINNERKFSRTAGGLLVSPPNKI